MLIAVRGPGLSAESPFVSSSKVLFDLRVKNSASILENINAHSLIMILGHLLEQSDPLASYANSSSNY